MWDVVFFILIGLFGLGLGILIGLDKGKQLAKLPATEKELKLKLQTVVQEYIDETCTVIVQRIMAKEEKTAK